MRCPAAASLLVFLALPGPAQEPPASSEGIVAERCRLEFEVGPLVVLTRLEATFRNGGGEPDGEAVWEFPLLPGSVVYRSEILVSGISVPTRTLPAATARELYRQSLYRRVDPLLLEYAGKDRVRARLFPLPPGGTLGVRLLAVSLPTRNGPDGELLYGLPGLACRGRHFRRLEFRAAIAGDNALARVHCGALGSRVERTGGREATVSWAGRGRTGPEMAIRYRDDPEGFRIRPFFQAHAPGEGTFLLHLAGRLQAEEKVARRRVTVLVDTSLSVAPARLRRIQAALRSLLRSLEEEDLFNLIPFATRATPLFARPRPLSGENRRKAVRRITSLANEGGTNLAAALAAATPPPRGRGRTLFLLFTDGRPTVGDIRLSAIAKRLEELHAGGARIFLVGLGNEVDRDFLTRLAAAGRGDTLLVTEGRRLPERLAWALAGIASPALEEVQVRLEGLMTSGLSPHPLPDLQPGKTLAILGRYRGRGSRELTLQGRVGWERHTWHLPLTLPETVADRNWLRPLWAGRRVAYLLGQIERNGPQEELVTAIREAGQEAGIITPWTSHYVGEEEIRRALARAKPPRQVRETRPRRRVAASGGSGGSPFAGGVLGGALAPPATPAMPGLVVPNPGTPASPSLPSTPGMAPHRPSGPVALRAQDPASAPGSRPVEEELPVRIDATLRRAGGKNFLKSGDIWVDQAFYGLRHKWTHRRIRAGSRAYYRLLETCPGAACWVRVGGKVLVVVEGKVWLIVTAPPATGP